MALLADDQMVMDRDFQGLADRNDLMGEVDIIGRGLWIARWMIMHQYTQ
jgi:hypothetical protein